MIKKIIYRQLFTQVNKFTFSSDHHGPTPTKL
jgi:hypothetical protein